MYDMWLPQKKTLGRRHFTKCRSPSDSFSQSWSPRLRNCFGVNGGSIAKTLILQGINISHLGKFGKSSTQNAIFWGDMLVSGYGYLSHSFSLVIFSCYHLWCCFFHLFSNSHLENHTSPITLMPSMQSLLSCTKSISSAVQKEASCFL